MRAHASTCERMRERAITQAYLSKRLHLGEPSSQLLAIGQTDTQLDAIGWLRGWLAPLGVHLFRGWQ